MIDTFLSIWPMILIFSVILVSIRLAYLIKNKEKIIIYKELLMLMFIIYIMCLFHVVTFQDVNFGSSNFIIFKEIFRYEFGTFPFFKNVIGNALMFIPYGFFASYYLKAKKPVPIFILCLIASITIESTQLYIGRVFDIDDIILNVLGGLAGFYTYLGLISLVQRGPKIFKNELFLNISIIALIGFMLLYLGNIVKVVAL